MGLLLIWDMMLVVSDPVVRGFGDGEDRRDGDWYLLGVQEGGGASR